jgi:non-specific serine/threonine protein kinase
VLALLGTERLVTLTGTGGVGKTRLGLAVAAEVVDQYPDGVWLVELAALTAPGLVPATVARTLDVREEPGRSWLAMLADHLRGKGVLLVLDNCEHVVAECAALVTSLLRAVPGLSVLATSREALQLGGEQLFRVPSLTVPDPKQLPSTDLVGTYAAVRLFVARAKAHRQDFALDERNNLLVTTVCARLDGIPLPIELAAARVGSLPLEVLAQRLDQSITLLAGQRRDVLPRQQTLRAAMNWSYDLLSLPEQVLLRRLAVFVGGWTLEAAEPVCADEMVERWDVLDLLSALVNKSLVLLEEAAGFPRYRLLETVRQFAEEHLVAAGEATLLPDRHLAHFLALAEEAAPQLTGPEQGIWLARLEREHDNLRAALHWAREQEVAELSLRLAGALWRFWYRRGYRSEGREWLRLALALPGPATPAVRAMALHGAGLLAHHQGDEAEAQRLHEASLTLQRELGDSRGIATSLNALGNVALRLGDRARAKTLYAEALDLRRAAGDRWGIASSFNNLGNVAHDQGDLGQAMALYQESLALRRELGDKRDIAASLNNMAGVMSDQGDHAQSTALYSEALALWRELGDLALSAIGLGNLGIEAYKQGNYGRAVALHEDALAIWREVGDTWGSAMALGNLGAAAAKQGESARAGALLEEALALRRGQGDREGIASTLNMLGTVAALQGEHARAAALQRQALLLNRDLGLRPRMKECLESLAQVLAVQGHSLQAARLGGAAEAVRQALGTPLPPHEQADHDALVQAVRAALGEEAFRIAWAAGQALSMEEAISLALADESAG